MKKLVVGFLVLLGMSAATPALAGHGDPMGSPGLMLAEAQDLSDAVSTYGLRYNVQQAVFHFMTDVNKLADCVRGSARFVPQDHMEDVGVPRRCGRALGHVRRQFQPVNRYLYDTQWDLPEVYEIYREVKVALRAITVNGGGGGFVPALFTCTARDSAGEDST